MKKYISRQHFMMIIKALIILGLMLWLTGSLTSCANYKDITKGQQENANRRMELYNNYNKRR